MAMVKSSLTAPATEIKALAGLRTIRATLPDADLASTLGSLPGVQSVDRHGGTVMLSCSDPDAALEALYRSFQGIHDVEVTGGSLEEAFMELTSDRKLIATPAAAQKEATR